MNIVHVVESLGRGGLERMVIDLAEDQVNNGHSCLILCLFTAGELFDEAVSKNIKCLVCNKKNGVDISAILKLRKSINEHKADIVHTHNAVANYYVFYATYFNNSIRLINTRHGMGAKNPKSKRERHFKKTLHRTSYVVAVCNAAKVKLIEESIVSKEKCTVICNGIKVSNFDSLKSERDEKIKKNLSQTSRIVIGSVGRLNWAKDYTTLLDVLKKLLVRYNSIELNIVGGGNLLNELVDYAKMNEIEDDVIFHGDTQDVKPILKDMDIFVCTSVSEGYSIALLEASAAGIPIIATDVGGNSEIVQDQVNGFIVPSKNIDKISERVCELIDNQELREKFSMNGRAWVEKHGDINNMSQQYNDLYVKSLD